MARPRLKAVQKPRVNDDWQHCCRWCKHYCYSGNPVDGYKCYNKEQPYVLSSDSEILYAADMGEFSELIEETMMYPNTSTEILTSGLNDLFEKWGVSKKKRADFGSEFETLWEEFIQSMRDELDEAVLRKMNNIIDMVNSRNEKEFVGVEIGDPENFVCKYWE